MVLPPSPAPHTCSPGTRFFLVSSAWLGRWRGGVDPVDNQPLLTPDGGLRPRLVEGFDFEALTPEAWKELLARAGGGGPEIAREVVAGPSGEPRLDVYPIVVTVSLAREADGSWQDDCVEQVFLSHSASVRQLAEAVRNLLGAKGGTPWRLYGRLYGGDLVLVRLERPEEADQRVAEAPWCATGSAVQVLVELARKDGSWPSTRPRSSTASGKRPRSVDEAVGAPSHEGRKRKGSMDAVAANRPAYGPGAPRGPLVMPPPASAFARIPGSAPSAPTGRPAAFGPQRLNTGNNMASPALGVCGLANMGNTCYLNAVLQCLMQVQQFVKTLVDRDAMLEIARVADARGASRDASLLQPLAQLARMMWSSQHSVVGPGAVVHAVRTLFPGFNNARQHDAHEALLLLLDRLHEEANIAGSSSSSGGGGGGGGRRPVAAPDSPHLAAAAEEAAEAAGLEPGMQSAASSPALARLISSPGHSIELEESWGQRAWAAWVGRRERHQSFVLDLLEGQYESRLQCEACGFISSSFEPYSVLSLPLGAAGQAMGLEDCLRNFTSAEVLDAEEQWYCSSCREYRTASKKITLIGARLPKVLVLHLKRFTAFGAKLHTMVQFPVDTLDLAPYVRDEPAGAEEDLDMMSDEPLVNLRPPGARYGLVGVAKHVGTTMEGGHYTAQVLCSDRSWRTMDDAGTQAMAHAPDGCDAEAYLLFYAIQPAPR